MCVINKNRADVQALPAEQRQALMAFALERWAKATGDHALLFWNSLVEACIPDEDFVRLLEARDAAYKNHVAAGHEAGTAAALRLRYEP